jgi:hypothetical protein
MERQPYSIQSIKHARTVLDGILDRDIEYLAGKEREEFTRLLDQAHSKLHEFKQKLEAQL